MLASLHLLRLLESNHALQSEVLDNTFFNNCVSFIANLKMLRDLEADTDKEFRLFS